MLAILRYCWYDSSASLFYRYPLSGVRVATAAHKRVVLSLILSFVSVFKSPILPLSPPVCLPNYVSTMALSGFLGYPMIHCSTNKRADRVSWCGTPTDTHQHFGANCALLFYIHVCSGQKSPQREGARLGSRRCCLLFLICTPETCSPRPSLIVFAKHA